MLITMGIAAFFCIGIGVYPAALYALLPFNVDYEPYTAAHVLTQLQLLVFSALAFSVLMWHRIYPPELPSVNLDTDVVYRRWVPAVVREMTTLLNSTREATTREVMATIRGVMAASGRYFGEGGMFARSLSTSVMLVWVMVMLGVSLVLYYRA